MKELNEGHVFFSIIIPVYNNGSVLERCLLSVLNQTYDNIEIIVYDDGSNDNSILIESIYEQKDSRIKVFKHNKNQSLLVTRLDAMKEAKGQYILFVDGDDYVSKDMCETLKDKLNMNAYDILEFSYTIIPDDILVSNAEQFEYEPLNSILQRKYPHTVWNKAYSSRITKEILKHAKSFYCNMTEDAYFSSLFFYFASSHGIIDVPLYYYVKGGMSTTNDVTNDSVRSMIESIIEKNENLALFFEEQEPALVEIAKLGGYKDISVLVDRCMDLDLSISKRIGFLSIIDEYAGTTYAIRLEEKIKELLEKDAYLSKCGIKRRTIYFLKTEIKNISRKFRGNKHE